VAVHICSRPDAPRPNQGEPPDLRTISLTDMRSLGPVHAPILDYRKDHAAEARPLPPPAPKAMPVRTGPRG